MPIRSRCPGGRRYPAVVKPVSLSGSRGVIRVDTPEELVAAFGRVSALLSRPEIRALRSGSEHEILVEDFIAGREYAVEGLMSRGVFSCLAIFDKPDPLDGPFFEETIYVTPSRADAGVQRAIVDGGRAAASRSVSRTGRSTRSAASVRRGAANRRGCTCSKWRRARSAGCARRCCVSRQAARRPCRSSTCCSVTPSANARRRRVKRRPRR